jgi:hypothetical protein
MSLIESYKQDIRQYEKQKEALAKVRTRIQETVYANNLRYTINYEHLYNIIISLKKRFVPTDKEREQGLITE